MLREEQIDIRRRRAAEGRFDIRNVGRNRVFSDYQIVNPRTGGQYRVTIRGFDTGDNACDCPDFRTNTLGTCKHIEAVLAELREKMPEQVRRKKAAVTHPEIFLAYGEHLRVGIHLPPRTSDMLRNLSDAFFDAKGLWRGGDDYGRLIEAVEKVPEQVTIFSDAMEFMEREIERREMADREKALREAVDRGEEPEVLRNLLRVPLYRYQLHGAIFAACRGRSILGDDMGLGKTVQTLAAAELLARERGIERVLVVAPASVKYQWETEIRKYTSRPVQIIEGLADDRRSQYAQPTFYRLINYEQVVRDLDELNAWQPDLIVLDEAQRIKNWESKTSQSVHKLKSRYAIVLTGTPLENKLEDLYTIVRYVDDRRLGPAFQFLAEHLVIDADGKLVGYRNLESIRERLAPVLLRRTRAEVLGELPERSDTTVYLELADEQRAHYGEHNATLVRLLQKKYHTEVDRRRILACLNNLRMACGGTRLLDHHTDVSPKLDELGERLKELLIREDAGKVVVFSQWETMLRWAAERIEKLGLAFGMLHGGLPGAERRKQLDRFRDDPACRIFLSTDAGGTGLNLQHAATVINLEVPWNPAVLEQRIARVHRMGQHRPVQVLHFVMRDSVEERVLKTIEQKRALFDEIFNGTSDEIALEAGGRQAFLDALRDAVVPPAPVVVPPPVLEDLSLRTTPGHVNAEDVTGVLAAGVAFVEALAAALAEPSMRSTDPRTGGPAVLLPVPSPAVLQRGVAALKDILRRAEPGSPPPGV